MQVLKRKSQMSLSSNEQFHQTTNIKRVHTQARRDYSNTEATKFNFTFFILRVLTLDNLIGGTCKRIVIAFLLGLSAFATIMFAATAALALPRISCNFTMDGCGFFNGGEDGNGHWTDKSPIPDADDNAKEVPVPTYEDRDVSPPNPNPTNPKFSPDRDQEDPPVCRKKPYLPQC